MVFDVSLRCQHKAGSSNMSPAELEFCRISSRNFLVYIPSLTPVYLGLYSFRKTQHKISHHRTTNIITTNITTTRKKNQNGGGDKVGELSNLFQRLKIKSTKKRKQRNGGGNNPSPYYEYRVNSPSPNQTKPSRPCTFCKGEHWDSECPNPGDGIGRVTQPCKFCNGPHWDGQCFGWKR
jgi:hypothetical protein